MSSARWPRHALKAQVSRAANSRAYWEYLLDVALFTQRRIRNGVARRCSNSGGRLIGIGSLFIQEANDDEVRKGTCSYRSTC